MRCATLFLVPLFVLACDREPVAPDVAPEFAAADVWWDSYTVPNSGTVLPPCYDEGLIISGDAWVRWHTVVNGNHEHWTIQAGPLPGYKLVGETSGEEWLPEPGVINGTPQVYNYVIPLGEPFQVVAGMSKFVFENQSTGEVLSMLANDHFVRNAAGDVKVSFFVESCKVK